MMKLNNGQLKSPPGLKMSIYKPEHKRGEGAAVQLQKRSKTFQRSWHFKTQIGERDIQICHGNWGRNEVKPTKGTKTEISAPTLQIIHICSGADTHTMVELERVNKKIIF